MLSLRRTNVLDSYPNDLFAIAIFIRRSRPLEGRHPLTVSDSVSAVHGPFKCKSAMPALRQ